jgi:hypothetical protein
MNSENDVLRDQLRALMNFRPLEVPEYWSDPVVATRVGRMLTDAAAVRQHRRDHDEHR